MSGVLGKLTKLTHTNKKEERRVAVTMDATEKNHHPRSMRRWRDHSSEQTDFNTDFLCIYTQIL